MSHMDLGHHSSDINFMHEDSLDMHIGRLGRDYDNITEEKLRFVRNQENNLTKKSTQLELMNSEKTALQKHRLELTSDTVRKQTSALEAFLNKRLLEIQEMREATAKHKEFISRIKRDIRHNREEMKRLSHVGGANSLVAYRQKASHKVIQMKSRLQTKQRMSDKLVLERRRLRGLITHEVDVRYRFKDSFEHSNAMAKGDADRILENVDASVDAFEETNRLQHKFHALKDKHQRDSRHLGQRIKDIERILNSERDLKSFLCAKNKRRVPGGESGSGVSKRLVHALRNYEVSPQMVESLLLRIKSMTKESSPYGMVHNFQQREATIMSMLSFVTNTSKEIEDETNHLEVMLINEEDLVIRQRSLQQASDVQDVTEAAQLNAIQQSLDIKTDRIARRQTTTQAATAAVRQLCTDLVDRVILLPRPSAAASGSRGGNIYPDFLDDAINNSNLYDFLSVLENRVNDVRTKFDYLMLHSEQTKVPLFHPDDEENRLPHNRLHFARDLKSPAATAEAINTNDDDVDETEGGRRKLDLKPPNILESASMCDKVIDDDDLSPVEDEEAPPEDEVPPPTEDGASLKVPGSGRQPPSSPKFNKSSAAVISNAGSARQIAPSATSVGSTTSNSQGTASQQPLHHVTDRSDLREEVFGPKDDASGQRLQPVHESHSVTRIRSMSINPNQQQQLPTSDASKKDVLPNKSTNPSYTTNPPAISLPPPTKTTPTSVKDSAGGSSAPHSSNTLSVSPSSSNVISASNSAVFLEPLPEGQTKRERSDDANEIDGWTHDEFVTHLAKNAIGLTNSQLSMHDEHSTASNVIDNSVLTAVRRLTEEFAPSALAQSKPTKSVPQLTLPNDGNDDGRVPLSAQPSPTTNFIPKLPAGHTGRTRGDEVEWQPDSLARLDAASPTITDDGRSSPTTPSILPVGQIDRQRDFSVELSDIDLSAAVLDNMQGVTDDENEYRGVTGSPSQDTASATVDDAITDAADVVSPDVEDDLDNSNTGNNSNKSRRKTNTLNLYDERLVDADDLRLHSTEEETLIEGKKRQDRPRTTSELDETLPTQSKPKLGLSEPALVNAQSSDENKKSVRQRDDVADEMPSEHPAEEDGTNKPAPQ